MTPGPPSLRALIRVTSCAARARRPLQIALSAPSGSVFPLKTGSLLTLSTKPGEIAVGRDEAGRYTLRRATGSERTGPPPIGGGGDPLRG